MPIRYAARLLTTSGILALAIAAPAHAGLIDGSLNGAHILDHANVLAAAASAHVGDDRDNNVNTGADVRVQNNGAIGISAAVNPNRRVKAKSRRGSGRRAR